MNTTKIDCPKCDGRGEYTSDQADFQVQCENCEGSGAVVNPAPEETDTERISEQCEKDLIEIAHWFGGFDELRKIIDRLEDNADEAAYERYTSRY